MGSGPSPATGSPPDLPSPASLAPSVLEAPVAGTVEETRLGVTHEEFPFCVPNRLWLEAALLKPQAPDQKPLP